MGIRHCCILVSKSVVKTCRAIERLPLDCPGRDDEWKRLMLPGFSGKLEIRENLEKEFYFFQLRKNRNLRKILKIREMSGKFVCLTCWEPYVTSCPPHGVTVRDSAWHCMVLQRRCPSCSPHGVTVCDSAWHCMVLQRRCPSRSPHGVTVCYSVWQCVTVCDSVLQCVTVC